RREVMRETVVELASELPDHPVDRRVLHIGPIRLAKVLFADQFSGLVADRLFLDLLRDENLTKLLGQVVRMAASPKAERHPGNNCPDRDRCSLQFLVRPTPASGPGPLRPSGSDAW